MSHPAPPSPRQSLAKLRSSWEAAFGRPPGKTFSRKFMAKAIAWKMNVDLHGDISPRTKREMERIVAHVKAKRQMNSPGSPLEVPPPPSLVLKPGAQLVRVWRGETFVVDVTTEGFEWKGQLFSSLTAVAKAITGTQWNGLKFFGLRQQLPTAEGTNCG